MRHGCSALPQPRCPDASWLGYSPGRQATPLLSTSGFTSLTMEGAGRPPQADPEAGDLGGTAAVEVSSGVQTLPAGFDAAVPVVSFAVSAPSSTIPGREAAGRSSSTAPPKRAQVNPRLGREGGTCPPAPAPRSSSSPRASSTPAPKPVGTRTLQRFQQRKKKKKRSSLSPSLQVIKTHFRSRFLYSNLLLKVPYRAVRVCWQPRSLEQCEPLAELQQLEHTEAISQLLPGRAAPPEQSDSPDTACRLLLEKAKPTQG